MKIHAWLTVILTALLSLAAGLFHVTGYTEVISHPQFTCLDKMDDVQKIISAEPLNMFYYKSYFILDLVWAPVLLYLIFRFMNSHLRQRRDGKKEMAGLPIAFLIFAVLAYSFDVLENIGYLGFRQILFFNLSIELVVKCKLILYSFVVLILIIFLFQRYVSEKVGVIRKAIKASTLSLLIIILILLLATQMDQGSTVIIDLLEHPISMMAAIVYLNVLAMACAHYPDYLILRLNQVKNIQWTIHPSWLYSKTGVGLILYSYLQNTSRKKEALAVQRQVKDTDVLFFDHFRKNLGTLLLLIWIYALLFVFEKYEIPYVPKMPVFLACIVLSTLFYLKCYTIKLKWQDYFKLMVNNTTLGPQEQMDAELKQSIEENIPAEIKFFLRLMIYVFILQILSTAVTIYLGFTSHWEMTGISLLITSVISIFFFISFQHFRKIFSFYTPPAYLRWLQVHQLNDDLTYIGTYTMMGWIALITVIVMTFQPMMLNALVWIILFFYLIYGIIVVLIKHYLFYKAEVQKGVILFPYHFVATFFYQYVPVLAFLIVGWMLFAGQAGNGLHALKPVTENADQVTYETYANALRHNLDSTHNQSVYFIASYGGGLRASAWTMLLLDTLEQSKPEFYKTTAAMSGVSGGFLGLSFFNAIMTEYTEPAERRKKIDTIGRDNLLGIDVAYLFGFDFVREQIPYVNQFYFKDRAGRSMQEYARLIQTDKLRCDSLLKTSYRNYWAKGFQHSADHYHPVLIGNTTGTHSRYGVAFPIQTDAEQFALIFPGAVDILSLHQSNNSISYLDATSTTERFPVFSPSAQIDGKGHFLDGGYFENSGLLSLMNFHDYLVKDSVIETDSSKIILIINSKDAYVRKVMGDTVIAKDELATGELFSILNTVADIDILPLALEARYRQIFGDRFIPIYLPYKITFQDVKKLIRGTPQDPFLVQQKINASNDKIDDTWKNYSGSHGHQPVPPALARVLSTPGYEYLKAMLNHPEVKEALKKIQ